MKIAASRSASAANGLFASTVTPSTPTRFKNPSTDFFSCAFTASAVFTSPSLRSR